MTATPQVDPSAGEAATVADGPWAAWMWRTIIVVALIDAAWLAATPVSLATSNWSTIAGIGLCLLAGRWLAHRTRHRANVHSILTGGTMLLAAWPALRIFNHLTMTTAVPWADAQLAAWDGLIRFDWAGYIAWIDQYPWLIKLMGPTYRSLDHYSAGLFVILAFGSDPANRCAEFLKLFLITAVVCMTIGMCFPAQAASVFHGVAGHSFENIPPRLGAYHLPLLEELRSNPAAVLDLDSLPGLVTFPSFHTAMGVLAIYCARHYWALFVASLIVNLTMIASTPLFGAHYAIDLIGGALVAGAAILCLRLKPAIRPLPAQLLRLRPRHLT
jgi:membrane-associated phospholipid phosphatase